MLVLTSNGLSNDKIYNMILAHANIEINRIAIITTAVVNLKEEAPWVIAVYDDFINKGYSNISYFDFENDDPKELLEYDLIYFMGGNPFYLLFYMYKSESINIIKEIYKYNKILIGRSAGSIVLSSGTKYIEEFNQIMRFGDDVANGINLENHDGVLLSTHIIFPHYDKFMIQNHTLENKLKQIEERDKIVIERIKNGEALILNENETFEIRNA